MKNRTFSLIKFAPDKNLAIALGAAVLCVMASAFMNLTDSEIVRVILRQFVQVIGISLVLSFFLMYHKGFTIYSVIIFISSAWRIEYEGA